METVLTQFDTNLQQKDAENWSERFRGACAATLAAGWPQDALRDRFGLPEQKDRKGEMEK